MIEDEYIYCSKCTTKECTYISTQNMIELLQATGYEHIGCPDKEDPQEVQKLFLKVNPNRKPYILSNSKHCTADIRMMNDYNKEIYLEIKRILYPYENKKEIGNSKAIERIIFLITEIFITFDEYADFIRDTYTICITNGHICNFDIDNFNIENYINEDANADTYNSKEISCFIDKFINYINDHITNLNKFIFPRNGESIEIIFKKGLPVFSGKEVQSTGTEISSSKISNILLGKNGFCFEIPINSSNEIYLKEYVKLITDPYKILKDIKKNLEQAKNSFYGVDEGRYVIQEISFRWGYDGMYIENESINIFGEIFIDNINNLLSSQDNEISEYKKYFDQCYIFISLGSNTFRCELF